MEHGQTRARANLNSNPIAEYKSLTEEKNHAASQPSNTTQYRNIFSKREIFSNVRKSLWRERKWALGGINLVDRILCDGTKTCSKDESISDRNCANELESGGTISEEQLGNFVKRQLLHTEKGK